MSNDSVHSVDSRLVNTSATFTARSRWSIGIVATGLVGLHFTPVHDSLGLPIGLLIALVSVFDPYAALLMIAGSQVAPDPVGSPLSLAQMFVLFWIFSLPVNGCLKYLRALNLAVPYALGFVLWWFFTKLVNDTFEVSWIYAFITGAIAITYAAQIQQPERLLWMLVAGTGLAVIGYWGSTVGLPVVGKNYDHFNRGGLRFGSGRGDVNTTAQNLGFFLYTGIALLLAKAASWSSGSRYPLLWQGGLLVVVALPPLIATGSRGGLGYLIFGGVAVVVYLLLVARLRRRFAFWVISIGLALPIFFVLFSTTLMETVPGRMFEATIEYNREQSLSAGGNATTAGRAEIWSKFLDIAATHPFLGVPRGAYVDMGEYGSGYVGSEDLQGGAGHNVFIDLAASTGFIGAILFAILFFWPLLRLVRRRGKLYAMPFVIAHLMVFLVFSNLSVGNWKTYWALFAITVVAASNKGQRLTNSRIISHA